MAQQNIPANSVAVVDSFQGEGYVQRADGSRLELKVNMPLREGDVVVTQPGSMANIQLAQGGAVQTGRDQAQDAVAIDKSVLETFSGAKDAEKVNAKTAEAVTEVLVNGNKDLGAVMEATAAGAKVEGAGVATTAPVVLQGVNTTTNTNTNTNANANANANRSAQGQDLSQTQEATAAGGTTSTVGTDRYVVLQSSSSSTANQSFSSSTFATSFSFAPVAPVIAVAPVISAAPVIAPVVVAPSVAVADQVARSEDQSITGNVLGNDVNAGLVASFGVAGTSVNAGQSIALNQGTLTLNADG